MNNRNIKSIIVLVAIISLIIIYIASNSFAYEYKNSEYTLFYNEDESKMKEAINEYISDLDNYLIPNSSYIYSEILTENYDFITNFALDYIINHKELYIDRIKYLDLFSYYDVDNREQSTNEYIDIEEIYNITDKYFGIRDYYIINDNVREIENYISLSDYTKRIFSKEIKEIKIEKKDNTLIAIIKYDDIDIHKYTFKIINNVLKIYNIEVVQ